MVEKTQGIVLQSIRYGDSSLIVRIYTLSNGLQSYMVKGVSGNASRNRIAFFQPLTLLSFVQTGNTKKGGMAFMKDVELGYVYQSIPMDMNKSAILMYLAELLSYTLTQQERNDDLYHFVHQSLMWLDLVDSGYANFPLYFTLELSRFLGFYPHAKEDGGLFDMMEGQFVKDVPLHPYYFDEEYSALLSRFLNRGIDELRSVAMTGLQRNALLDGVITFMRLHAPVLKGLQSHEILKSVLR